MPKVSVVLPVYNVAAHIEDTIASVLQQTFTDFELLVLDDCSTDDTVARIQALAADPRLRLIQNPRNLGRAGTDNSALAYVQGEYIAKMDGDDLCHPERLARQVSFLDNNPAVNVVGSALQNFGASTYLNRYPATPAQTRVRTLFTMPVANPTVMLRTSLLREQAMEYDQHLRQTEDYDFFARYLQHLSIVNLTEPLVQYRMPYATTKVTILSERSNVADDVRARLLRSWDLPFTDRELQLHNTITMLDRPLRDIKLAEVEDWLTKLEEHNKHTPWFDTAALAQELGERWFEVCYTHVQPLFGSVREFKKSRLASYYAPTARQQLKMWVKAVRGFY